MAIWRMRIACRITKSQHTRTRTHTHTIYKVVTVFPFQQCLHERARISRCTYIVCLVNLQVSSSSCRMLCKRLPSGLFVRRVLYRDADKSLARPTLPCILFDGENISFYDSLVMYINSTNIPPIMVINRIYKYQNLLSL